MTNERKNADRDRLVRDTDKALAKKTAPDRLNDQVLRQAADAGRSRYSLTRAWTRPVAWAATIGLSLAIVLDLTRLPQTESDAVGISALERPVPVEQGATADAPAAGGRNDVSMDEFAPRDMAVLRDAQNTARAQDGANQAPVAVRRAADTAPAEEGLAAASFTAVSEKEGLESEYACPEESRKSAESWFACVEQLRADGLADRAAGEYEKFRQKFPDFVGPTADK